MLAPYKFPDLTPLGDVKPRTFTPDLDGLIAWLRTQDGATEWNFADVTGCLVCEFTRAIDPSVNGWLAGLRVLGLDASGCDSYGKHSPILEVAQMSATYAAALSRALSLRSESPVGGKVGEP